MQSPSDQPSRKRASVRATTGSWWRNLALPVLPVLACFLGGATEKWSEGIIVALLGVILLVDPPRHSLGPALNTIILALLACALVGFLPAAWFAPAEWRTVMLSDFSIKLPGTVSPQPWITLGCFVSFLAALSWVYYMCAHDKELRAVRSQLRLFATGEI